MEPPIAYFSARFEALGVLGFALELRKWSSMCLTSMTMSRSACRGSELLYIALGHSLEDTRSRTRLCCRWVWRCARSLPT